ncbi:aldo/keto reductase, partial [Staphylococcus cohnii]|uniref:aldo/keto reductase n=1 Tax=Staphylococcus cohnii TaxID=29382 RepID=UPI00164260C3
HAHPYDHTKKHITQTLQPSLKQLQLQQLHSLLIHRPSPFIHPHQITQPLKSLLKQPKIKSFPLSNFNKSHYHLLTKSLVSDKLH